MSKRLEIEKYGVDSYDDYLCLRPSWTLIACVIFLCRGLLVFALFGLSGGVPAAFSDIVDAETLWQGCVAAASDHDVYVVSLLFSVAFAIPDAMVSCSCWLADAECTIMRC